MAGEYELDFRAHPEAYRFQSGEQGVFKVEPYKSELLPLWSFKNEETARESVEALREKYGQYRAAKDFVGMDMARKYLQMGFTRAMRYAKYPGGKKYDDDGTERDPQQWADPEKRRAAIVFRDTWQAVKNDSAYQQLKHQHTNAIFDEAASPM